RLSSFLDSRDDLGLQRLHRNRADVLVDEAAVAIDDECLGHAVDAPLDRRAPVAVDADSPVRIAVTTKEAACRGRLVLIVDPVEIDRGPADQLDQDRMLLRARHAPGRPKVHDRNIAACELAITETGYRLAVVDEPWERLQRELRDRLADQRRRQPRRITGLQRIEEHQRERAKDDERREDPAETAPPGSRYLCYLF